MQRGHSISFWLNEQILDLMSLTVFDLSAAKTVDSSHLNFELLIYSWHAYLSYSMSFTFECFACNVLRSSKAFDIFPCQVFVQLH